MKKSREKVKESKATSRGLSYGLIDGCESRGVIISVVIAVIFIAIFLVGCKEQQELGYVYPARFFAKEMRSEAVEIIRKGLSDSDPQVRANAAEVVASTRLIMLMPKVENLLDDGFVPVRFSAALAVGSLEYSFASEAVKPLLEDADENVRMAAAYAMSRLRGYDEMAVLSNSIASEDQTVRANAALLLGKSGDRKGLKYLYWALRHKNSDDKVRLQAVESIANLGDERIYPKLWTMLISTYADDRMMGVKGMGSLGTEQAKNSLITMLDDDILEVRLAAAEQLGALGETIGEPEVLDVFRKNLTEGMDKEGRERVLTLAALAIGEVGTDSLTTQLPELINEESKFVSLAAAKAILQVTSDD